MSTTDYCECDNTHEQNETVCQFCWEMGIRYNMTVEEIQELATPSRLGYNTRIVKTTEK